MKKFLSILVILLLTACDDAQEKPHLVSVCIDGHWGTTTESYTSRGGSIGFYDTTSFVCDVTVLQCQAGDGFIGEVKCE